MGIFEDDFSDILRKARFGRGVSVDSLAEATQLAPARIEAFEAGDASPPPTRDEVGALARALQLGEAALWQAAAELRQPVQVAGFLPSFWELRRFIFPGLDANGYLLIDHEAGGALLVDPGGVTPEFAEALAGLSVPLRASLLTHAHPDHVGALPWLRGRMPDLPIVAHPLAARELELEGIVYAPRSEEELTFEGLTVEVWFAPGHSADGLCFRVGGAVFVGDTLFAGSLGRSERGVSTYPQLLASARRLLTLPATTVLLPGHGPPTTVGAEMEGNPFLAGYRGVGHVAEEGIPRDG